VWAMETGHIRNALRMLKRNGFVSPDEDIVPSDEHSLWLYEPKLTSPFIDYFEQELQARGEEPLPFESADSAPGSL